jgi:hypothetical protein
MRHVTLVALTVLAIGCGNGVSGGAELNCAGDPTKDAALVRLSSLAAGTAGGAELNFAQCKVCGT